MSLDTTESTRIKSAAEALRKGGTLVGQPCPKCGGVQIRIGEKTSCINCGNETIQDDKQNRNKDQKDLQDLKNSLIKNKDTPLAIIEDKITTLAIELKDEREIIIQKQKIELLEMYLGLLEKMKVIFGK
jgi:UPF0148 protein